MTDKTPADLELDAEIERLSQVYPEISEPERQQAENYRQAAERGPNLSYPEFEGPGFTEPPDDWEGWHQDHSEHDREHYWDSADHDMADPDQPDYSTWYTIGHVVDKDALTKDMEPQDQAADMEMEAGG